MFFLGVMQYCLVITEINRSDPGWGFNFGWILPWEGGCYQDYIAGQIYRWQQLLPILFLVVMVVMDGLQDGGFITEVKRCPDSPGNALVSFL